MPARCFLAIDLPAGVVRTLGHACRAFAHDAPHWTGEKWVRPESLHVTVRFIGPITDSALAETLDALVRACASHAAYTLSLDTVRAVPSPRRAAMLWASYCGDVGICAALARDVDAALGERLGLSPDTRLFMPHTTLVRARAPRPVPPAALAAAQTVLDRGKVGDRSVSVRSVTLYASTLGPSGPSYEALGRVSLAG